MDDETRAFLLGALSYLEQHQKMLKEVMLVTYALQKAFQELSPEAAQLYAKHWMEQKQGPLGQVDDEAQKALALLIQRLNKLS